MVPVSLRTADGLELTCSSVNLSISGLAVDGVTGPLAANSILQVRFALPNSATSVCIKARAVWTGTNGRAGLTFTEIGAQARLEMRHWLSQKMQEEGWDVEPSEQAVAD